MKRTVIAALLALAAVAMFALPGMTSQPECPKAKIELKYFPKKIVYFSHTPHLSKAGAACETCHHKKVDGKIAKCSTAGCHDVFDRKAKGEKSFYNIVHGRSKNPVSCINCHRDAAKGLGKKEKKFLTGCMKSTCHH